MSKSVDHTGETNIAKNGLKMTIIACRKHNDIDVQFEDGITVYNKQYGNFKTGTIKHPNINVQTNNARTDRIGETNIAYNGMEMEIIEYYNKNNITIKFRDGTIVHNKRYSSFKKGEIKNPNINVILEKNKNHIGEINIANNGLRMTIIEYHNAKNIAVQFEDSTIVYNKTYHGFKKGEVKHPNINTEVEKNKNHIGEINIANNGLRMTIIEYHNAKNITVQFEDGTIAYNKTYGNFKKGTIRNPITKTDRMNETNTTKNGLKIKIIKYYSADNIAVKFEDGVIVYNKRYVNFRTGLIKHPNIINNIKLKEFAYKLNNDWYYICSHPTWTEDKILSVKEIYAYQLKQIA